MRKVKYFVANSLDGLIARPDGAVDWLFMDGTDYGMSEFFKSIDAMLLGRKTYEFALKYQKSSKSKSSKSRTAKSKNIFGGISSYVFSRTLKDTPDDGAAIVSENAGEFVRELKRREGKDIWLMGGGELARSLFAENVVDEISLTIHPLLLGAGIPLFPEIGRQIDLELLNCKAHKNGCVQVSYRVKS